MTADTVALWVALVVLCAGVLAWLSYKSLRAAGYWLARWFCGNEPGGRK